MALDITPSSFKRTVALAIDGAIVGSKRAAGVAALRSGIGSGYSFKLIRSGTTVLSLTMAGQLPIVGTNIVIQTSDVAAVATLSTADIDTGTWTAEIAAASGSNKITGTAGKTTGDIRVAADLASGGSVTLSITIYFPASLDATSGGGGSTPVDLTPPLPYASGGVIVQQGAVAVPSDFMGFIANRWPASGNGSSVSPAPTYTFGSVRRHDYEYTQWNRLNPAPGQYAWQYLQPWYDTHVAAGRTLLFQLYGTPTWAASNSISGPYNGIGEASMPSSQSAVASFIDALLARFPEIDFISVWNEPDFITAVSSGVWRGDQSTVSYWTGTNVEMATLTRWVAQAAKARKPSVQIVGWDFTGMDYGTAASQYVGGKVDRVANASDGAGGTGAQWIDAYSWHHYNNDSGSTFDAVNLVAQIKAQIAHVRGRTGWANKPIYQTEFGFHQWGIGNGGGTTSSQKATLILRHLMIFAATGHAAVHPYTYDSAFLGTPSTDSTIAAALSTAQARLPGKTIRNAGVLTDGSVWLNFSDGTEYRV